MESDMNTKKLGGDIDSWCGKCKMILTHTIEAMVKDKPTRVLCNTCKSSHTYKASAPGTSRATKPREGEAAPVRRTKGRASKYQMLLDAKNTAVAKTYSPSNKYEEGDILDHPTFGRGVTMAIKDVTKIEVLFEGGSKLLVHGR
jgi:hypothetical protein